MSESSGFASDDRAPRGATLRRAIVTHPMGLTVMVVDTQRINSASVVRSGIPTPRG